MCICIYYIYCTYIDMYIYEAHEPLRKTIKPPTADSKSLEHGCRIICAGVGTYDVIMILYKTKHCTISDYIILNQGLLSIPRQRPQAAPSKVPAERPPGTRAPQ